MNETDSTPLRPLKVIVAALTAGLLVFVCVVIFIVEGGTVAPHPPVANMLLPVMLVMAMGETVAYVALRISLRKKLQDDDPSGATPLGSFAAITIIGCAMAEGLGVMGVVTYLVSGNHLALVAPGMALPLLTLQFPTEARLQRFASQDGPINPSQRP